MMTRAIALLPLLVALAACGQDTAEVPADDRRGAEGEVLGGTISDAMLPLDTVQSQSPPLREAPARDGNRPSLPEEQGEEAEQVVEPAAPAEDEMTGETAPEETDS